METIKDFVDENFVACLIGLIVLFVVLILIIMTFRFQLEEEEKKNRHLEKENQRLLAQMLKFQIDPHTIKNLVELIRVYIKNLYKGTESISNLIGNITYINRDDDGLVSIQEELDRIEDYIRASQNLFNKKGNIHIDKSKIDEQSIYYKQHAIPFLISLPLIENAIKHGDKYADDFLNIQISLQNDIFVFLVQNKIDKREKETVSQWGGMGFKNTKKRLEFFCKDNYSLAYKHTEDFYTVKLEINLDKLNEKA